MNDTNFAAFLNDSRDLFGSNTPLSLTLPPCLEPDDTDALLASEFDRWLQESGLDWTPELRDLTTRHPETGEDIEIPNFKAVIHPHTNQVLHVASPRYRILSHIRMFGTCLPLIRDHGFAPLKMGFFDDGAVPYFVLQAPATHEFLKNDKVQPYLMYVTSHNGTFSGTPLFTSERFCCRNSFVRAMQAGDYVTHIRHTESAEAKLDALPVMLEVFLANDRLYAEQCGTLAESIFPTYTDISDYMHECFRMHVPGPDAQREGKILTAEQATAISAYNAKIDDLVNSAFVVLNREAALLNVPTTNGWLVFNAVSHVIQHNGSVASDAGYARRVKSNLIGNRSASTRYAFQQALSRLTPLKTEEPVAIA
jgi:hypothetical protein